MNNNHLIETFTPKQANILSEAKVNDKGEKNWYLEGIFVQAEIKNLNGRIYPRKEIENAVNDINKRAQDFTVWGELDHPEEIGINLSKVSHLIEKMWMDGNNGMGRLRIIDTPMGNIAQAMLEVGGKIGVSSRGTGELDYNGIVHNYQVSTIDIVCTPSGMDCKPRAIFEAFNGNGGARREDLVRSVRHDPKAQKYLQKELLTWLNSI